MRTNQTSTKTALLALAAITLPAMFAQADTYSWENFQSDIAGVPNKLASIGQALGPSGLGSSAPTNDVSIAFESIDGLPRDVSPRLVHDLGEEAAALRIAVAPAGSDATYRRSASTCPHVARGGRMT